MIILSFGLAILKHISSCRRHLCDPLAICEGLKMISHLRDVPICLS